MLFGGQARSLRPALGAGMADLEICRLCGLCFVLLVSSDLCLRGDMAPGV